MLKSRQLIGLRESLFSARDLTVPGFIVAATCTWDQ